MRAFSIIAALDSKNGIGKNGKLPWRLKGDMRHFQSMTVGHRSDGQMNSVIMGRKTWESLPEKFRPLPDRLNVIVTRQVEYPLPPNVLRAGSLDKALAILDKRTDISDVFVIGGAELYRQAIQHQACERLYITEVTGDFDCDVFFPNIPKNFKMSDSVDAAEEDGIHYRFAAYTRRTE